MPKKYTLALTQYDKNSLKFLIPILYKMTWILTTILIFFEYKLWCFTERKKLQALEELVV